MKKENVSYGVPTIAAIMERENRSMGRRKHRKLRKHKQDKDTQHLADKYRCVHTYIYIYIIILEKENKREKVGEGAEQVHV